MNSKTRYTFVKHGKKRNILGYFDSLWRTGDHLLLVQNRIYTQSYKRFYFADIQGLTAQINNQRNVYAWILGATLTILLLLAAATGGPARLFWLCSAALFSIVFAINWLRGPTCTATIITKVQSHPLPISRLKNARSVFAQLRKDIEKHQGTLDLDQVTKPLALTRKSTIARDSNTARISVTKTTTSQHDPFAYKGNYHLFFFSILTVISSVNALQLYTQHVTIVLFEMLLFIGATFAMVLALKNQHASAMNSLLKTNTWGGLVLIFILIGISYIDFLLSITEYADDDFYVDHLQLILSMAHRDPADYPFWKFALYFHAISLLLISIPGLVLTFLFRKQRYVDV